MAKRHAVCASRVAGAYYLCKKPAKVVGEGGDRALPSPTILPGLLRSAVTWGLEG